MEQLIRGVNRPALETKLGRVPNVSGEGILDPSLKTKQLQSGLASLSTSLKEFGKASDARRIQNDIITARTAFALNEEMPGSLAPEAELAFNSLVATRSTQQFFRLLSDDAEVYGNGLLTDDENYPDHNSKQAAYEAYIDGAKRVFFDQAQFNPAQQEAILGYTEDRTNTFKAEFATLAAKDIKSLKKNETAKFIQESILDRKTNFNQIRKKTIKEMLEWTPENHIKSSALFTREWHEDLKKQITIANPHLTEDEIDESIIQQIGLLATDPDNPHPEYLEYFKESGKKGKPAINIIPSLAKNARSLYVTARSNFISQQKAQTTLENEIQTRRENLAHINAQNWVIQEISNIEGHRDLSKMTTAIRKQFPHITGTKLQSVVNFANTLISADKKDGDAQLTSRMVLEAHKGHLSMLDFESDSRFKQLNQGQIVEVQKAITDFSVGKVSENNKQMIAEVESIRDIVESAIASKTPVNFGGETYVLGKSERIKFNTLTGRPTGFSPKATSIIDAIVNEYHDAAERIIFDEKYAKPSTARRELNKLKYEFLRRFNIHQSDTPITKIPTKKVKDSRNFAPTETQLFDEQLKEDTTPEAINKDKGTIIELKPDVPDDFNVSVHVPPTKVFIDQSKLVDTQLKEDVKSKDTQTKVETPKPISSLSGSDLFDKQLGEDLKDEKDTGIPGDVPTDVSRGIESVPVIKTQLNQAQERTAAFDKAFPDKPPSEKVKLRELQDKAEFQSDKTIFDAISDLTKSVFKTSAAESSFDNIKENNPLNVEKRNNYKWQGEVKGTSNRFVSADTPKNGIRLGVSNFLSKFKRGLTLKQTIEKISPKKDNNPTSTIIDLVSKLSKLKPTDKLEVSMDNFKTIKQITKGLLKFEAPNHNYSDSLIDEAIKEAIQSQDNLKDSPNLKVSSLQQMFGANEAEASKLQMIGNTKGTSPTIYKIKQGDTLSKIAKDNGMTVKELQKLNNIKNVNKIRAGQVINVGKFSMNIKDVKPPQVPDDVPKFFKENLIPVYGSHADAALRQMIASQIERAGLPVPDYLKKTITEKAFAPDVLNSVRVAAYKALINKRSTSYRDYGDAWKLVYGNERSKMSYVGQALKAVSSFFDPGMAAAFTIGESAGVVVRNGNLMIVGDEFNFPKIPKGTHDESFWHDFNSMFSDEDDPGEGEAGIFSVTPKNRQKIEINLGPIDQIKKYVKQLGNKKDKKVK